MQRYKATSEQMKKKYAIDEEWELIGYFNKNIPVYSCSRDFLIIQRHVAFENYNVYEFENSEVSEIDFRTFALKYCKGFFKTFVSLEEKENFDSLEILKFVKNGNYGDIRIFKNLAGDVLSIIIVPGGYIYRDQAFDC